MFALLVLTSDPSQLLDYDAARKKTKQNKTLAKPGDDPTKLPQAQQEHEEVKEVFDILNDQLIVELPQLLSLRVPHTVQVR